MADEAFPNSKQLFLNAFSHSDPVPELSKLIKENPTFLAVFDLVANYTSLAEGNPSRADPLASALVSVRDAPDAPSIGSHKCSLAEVISRELASLHSQGFAWDNDTKSFGPNNAYLINSLLSGLSFKHTLASSPEQYRHIMIGLDAKDSWPTAAVQVTGACIQLLLAGSKIIPSATSYIKSADEVATKLKAQKSAGIVKDPNALKILELAISHAEMGFAKENDITNVWDILFPIRV